MRDRQNWSMCRSKMAVFFAGKTRAVLPFFLFTRVLYSAAAAGLMEFLLRSLNLLDVHPIIGAVITQQNTLQSFRIGPRRAARFPSFFVGIKKTAALRCLSQNMYGGKGMGTDSSNASQNEEPKGDKETKGEGMGTGRTLEHCYWCWNCCCCHCCCYSSADAISMDREPRMATHLSMPSRPGRAHIQVDSSVR